MTNTINPIRVIALDLDGTLLNSHNEVSPRTEKALRRATAAGILVIIATGRPRMTSTPIIKKLGLTTPGVFLQGLNIHNGDGSIRYQRLMDVETARRVATFADNSGYSALIYNSDSILTRARNAMTDRMIQYHEPPPEVVGPLAALPGKVPINKFVFVDTPERIQQIRRELAVHVNGSATLLTSAPHLLEALPLGTSKGAGLEWLLDDIGISMEHVMAVGDGENDIEMLEMAAIGVAMGNAPENVKRAADYVTANNDEDGIPQAIEHFVLSLNPSS
jgi:Cof subfamily protein (haloacid dehalogenase superfamily)